MSARFVIPEWLGEQSAPPLPPVDDHRVESLVNRFIAGKQEALFDAPDAFYRQQGADALAAEPALAQRLQDLRAATLDLARDDGERAALGPRLDAHVADAMDGIGRHVAAQRTVFQRHTLAERQALIRRAPELEHDNDDKIAGLAEAHASAAQELGRLDGLSPGSPEEAARLNEARSQILSTAIAERIGAAKNAQAVALFERVKDTLTPADRCAFEVPIGVAADEAATDAWLEREADKDGAPLAERAGLDDTLSAQQRLILRAKLAARESAEESRRVATVKGLDDRRGTATAAMATQPSLYRTGTLAGLAGAYDAAGAPEQADEMRRPALLEPFFRSFAQLGVAAQQRHLESLSGPERAMAEAIMSHQADAFARDPYAAGTALYAEVGSPLPAEDAEGRFRQVRMIEARRGATEVPQPAAVLTPVNLAPNLEMHSLARTAPDADAAPVAARDVQIAQAAPDGPQPIGAPGRGVAPMTEPPSNDPDLEHAFERWPGVYVILKNGRRIPDPTSPTGYVMAPFNDLDEVAAAGRKIGREVFATGLATLSKSEAEKRGRELVNNT